MATINTEYAEITAAKLIARAKECGYTQMGIEVSDNGSFVAGVLRCTYRYSVAKSRVTWHLDNRVITKELAITALAVHFAATGEVIQAAKKPASTN